MLYVKYMPRRLFDRRLALIMPFVAILLVAVACSGDDKPKEPPPGTTAITLTTDKGAKRTLFVEIADEPSERSVGLSGRTNLADDSGMLFVIPVKGIGFWMKDTLIPLSVAFLGPCGEVVHIADMQPQTLDLHDTDRPYNFGLEVNQGWFSRHGIGVGARVELPQGVRPASCS